MKKKLISGCMAVSLVACMTACSQSQPSQATPQSQETTAAETQAAEGIYTPGTYTATATGFGGEITVSMSFSESEILEVNVTGDKETEGVGSNAVANLPALIVEAQSADVEAVSGATISSKAIMQAAEVSVRQKARRRRSVK
jgi:fumarate reductase flavoprotein subunit